MDMNVTDYTFFSSLSHLPFIDEIWVFGSRARNDHQERADIDLAIVCPTSSEEDWLKVCNILENADTLYKIDCIRFDTLDNHSALRDNILKYHKVIYQKTKVS